MVILGILVSAKVIITAVLYFSQKHCKQTAASSLVWLVLGWNLITGFLDKDSFVDVLILRVMKVSLAEM